MNLIDVKRKRSRSQLWRGSTALVPFATTACLRCGGATEELAYGQLPLFRSHGHGAVKRTVLRVCGECSFAVVLDVTEVNPRRWVS